MPAVHRVFRSSLASAPQLIASTAGDDDRRAVVANYYSNLMAFLEVHHDGEEQLVFPLLIDRAPETREFVEEAASQHTEIVGLMKAARAGVDSWETGGDPHAPTAAQSLRDLDTRLSAHLDEEEVQILPLVEQHLTAGEWGKLPDHAMGSFEGDKIWLIMGLIRENFTQDQRDMMLSAMPPPARKMWETTGEASFDDLIARVRQVG